MKQLTKEHFEEVLEEVKHQVFQGKGKERHGRDKPLEHQSWRQIAEVQQSEQFLTGQALKKLMEMEISQPDYESWKREALGAIVYMVLAVMWRDHGENNDRQDSNLS